jgi:hypothetical protein
MRDRRAVPAFSRPVGKTSEVRAQPAELTAVLRARLAGAPPCHIAATTAPLIHEPAPDRDVAGDRYEAQRVPYACGLGVTPTEDNRARRAGIPWQGLEIAAMNEYPQPGQAFMSALVTEHFVLQSARSTTVSEAVGRSAVYLTCVSSAVVAFGFFAAATHQLAPVVATVLPALIILGVLTFVRLVETSVENLVFLRRMEAIRRYYAALDPAAAAFFAAGDSATTALAGTGMRSGLIEMFFTGASMIAAVTSILAGVGTALLLDITGAPLFAAVAAGVVVGFLAYGLHMRWMYRRGQPAMA